MDALKNLFSKWLGTSLKSNELNVHEHRKWKRVGEHIVALKTLHDSHNLAEFLNELVALQKSCGGTDFTGIIRVYGASQNPYSEEYIMVLDLAKDGDLRHYIRQNLVNYSWSHRIDTLHQIAVGLSQLHNKELVHRDFHGGNVLIHGNFCNENVVYVLVTDLGLCRSTDKLASSGTYASGELPFANVSHNIDLAFQICHGTRPRLPDNIPPFYAQLMQQCWDTNPSIRPSTKYIVETARKWLHEPTSDIVSELQMAEAMRLKSSKTDTQMETKIHPEAIYTSRLLPTPKYFNFLTFENLYL
ncbi:32532_t:CDS:2 [Racocetra persica]|uniref:32532_t:CDS:1 n=1 Tax=Racocetra persica TaxID=160502 RepID=A0ACA9QHB6_9GLOM|nr:32532_t:CDS:2 [Racocetra persica]